MEDSSDDSADELLALAASVASEARSLLGDGVIPRIAAPPAGAPPAVVAAFAADFARRFITPSVPVVLTGCCDGWPARGWNHAYLRSRLGSTPVHVALTPNGYADAVTPTEEDVGGCGGSGGAPSAVFAKPFEALQPFNEFVDALESPLDNGVGTRLRPVHYASHQVGVSHGPTPSHISPRPSRNLLFAFAARCSRLDERLRSKATTGGPPERHGGYPDAYRTHPRRLGA